jgi:hypothetical protein
MIHALGELDPGRREANLLYGAPTLLREPWRKVRLYIDQTRKKTPSFLSRFGTH